jgi:hypothetical protein
LLAFEDPNSPALWLCKGIPRDWLKQGSKLAASEIPTRWGRVGFNIDSHLDQQRINVALELPTSESAHETILRLRTPGKKRLRSVTLSSTPWSRFDPEAETISFPQTAHGSISLIATYE